MGKRTLFGMFMCMALAFSVGMASNGSKNDKPPKAKMESSYQSNLGVEVDGSFVYSLPDMENPYLIVINELKASPFSIAPVGTPNTKFKAQNYFYPLKLC